MAAAGAPTLSLGLALLGAFAGATIFLGLPVARMRSANQQVRGVLNAVAVGILVFLLAEVLLKGWEPVEEATAAAYAGTGAYSAAALPLVVYVLGLTFGLLSLVWFEARFLAAAAKRNAQLQDSASATTLAMMIAVGIGLHNFSEGLAIGASAASGALSFALLLGIGFALHNATEGFGIAAPLSGTMPSWRFLGAAGLVAGGPTFVGTLLGSLYTNPLLNVLFLSLAAGALLYVIKELLYHGRKLATGLDAYPAMAGLALGVLLGLGTDLLVTLAGV